MRDLYIPEFQKEESPRPGGSFYMRTNIQYPKLLLHKVLTDISPYPPPNIVILPFSGPISRVENRLTQTRGPRPALRSQNNASPRFLKMVDRQQLINLIHPLVVMSERQQENVYAPGERRTVLQKRRPRPSGRLSFLNGLRP